MAKLQRWIIGGYDYNSSCKPATVAHVWCQVGGSNASAAAAKHAVAHAVKAGKEPLHRSKTCWLHLKYAVDDQGALKLFTNAPGKYTAAVHLCLCQCLCWPVTCVQFYDKPYEPPGCTMTTISKLISNCAPQSVWDVPHLGMSVAQKACTAADTAQCTLHWTVLHSQYTASCVM